MKTNRIPLSDLSAFNPEISDAEAAGVTGGLARRFSLVESGEPTQYEITTIYGDNSTSEDPVSDCPEY